MSENFHVTHVVELYASAHDKTVIDRVEVMLVEGAAYSREEWEGTTPADFSVNEEGGWEMLGRPFNGQVKKC